MINGDEFEVVLSTSDNITRVCKNRWQKMIIFSTTCFVIDKKPVLASWCRVSMIYKIIQII